MTSCSLPSSSQSIVAVTVGDWAPCLTLLRELSGKGGGSRALLTCPGHHTPPAVPSLCHCKPARLGKKWAPTENLLLSQACLPSLEEAGMLWEALV